MVERHLTTSEIAAELRLKPATVQMYARERLIPFDETPGGHRRFDLDEVRTALASSKGRRASRADRVAAARAFGPSPRARAASQWGAARTTAADVQRVRSSAPGDVVEGSVSAAVSLFAGARGVQLSGAR